METTRAVSAEAPAIASIAGGMPRLLRLLLVLAGILILVGAVAAVIIAATQKSKKTPAGGASDSLESYFDGGTFQLIGWHILTTFLTGITLGIAYPWAMCMMERWRAKHTVISGRRLRFEGRGIGLFGKYLLWAFLTVITCGIYGIWFGLGMEKWRVSHTVYADSASKGAEGQDALESRFTGGAGGWFVRHILAFLLTVCTIGIGKAWADVYLEKWMAKNRVIGGSPLLFSGSGGQLFAKRLLFLLLTPLTLGIYALFYPVKLLKWKMGHTAALYRTEKIRTKVREQESIAGTDALKYRMAAGDTELAVLKSGISGNESAEKIDALAAEGNPYACYLRAMRLQTESGEFEGEALALLRKSADAEYPPALYEYAACAENDAEAVDFLEKSAKKGNREAAWALKTFFEKAAEGFAPASADRREALKKEAYWFYVATVQEHPEALAAGEDYANLLERLALYAARESVAGDGKISAAGIVCVAAGGGILLLGILFVAFLLTGRLGLFRSRSSSWSPTDRTHAESMPDGSADSSAASDGESSASIPSEIPPLDEEWAWELMEREHNTEFIAVYFDMDDLTDYGDTYPYHPDFAGNGEWVVDLPCAVGLHSEEDVVKYLSRHFTEDYIWSNVLNRQCFIIENDKVYLFFNFGMGWFQLARESLTIEPLEEGRYLVGVTATDTDGSFDTPPYSYYEVVYEDGVYKVAARLT